MEKNVFFYEEKASFGGENADGDEERRVLVGEKCKYI